MDKSWRFDDVDVYSDENVNDGYVERGVDFVW